jgi:hypothetical protein
MLNAYFDEMPSTSTILDCVIAVRLNRSHVTIELAVVAAKPLLLQQDKHKNTGLTNWLCIQMLATTHISVWSHVFLLKIIVFSHVC